MNKTINRAATLAIWPVLVVSIWLVLDLATTGQNMVIIHVANALITWPLFITGFAGLVVFLAAPRVHVVWYGVWALVAVGTAASIAIGVRSVNWLTGYLVLGIDLVSILAATGVTIVMANGWTWRGRNLRRAVTSAARTGFTILRFLTVAVIVVAVLALSTLLRASSLGEFTFDLWGIISWLTAAPTLMAHVLLIAAVWIVTGTGASNTVRVKRLGVLAGVAGVFEAARMTIFVLTIGASEITIKGTEIIVPPMTFVDVVIGACAVIAATVLAGVYRIRTLRTHVLSE